MTRRIEGPPRERDPHRESLPCRASYGGRRQMIHSLHARAFPPDRPPMENARPCARVLLRRLRNLAIAPHRQLSSGHGSKIGSLARIYGRCADYDDRWCARGGRTCARARDHPPGTRYRLMSCARDCRHRFYSKANNRTDLSARRSRGALSRWAVDRPQDGWRRRGREKLGHGRLKVSVPN